MTVVVSYEPWHLVYQVGTILDMAPDDSAKRPRIDNSSLDEITSMYPNMPFERAVNRVIEEAMDSRQVLAETILDLEGPRPNAKSMDPWYARRNELANLHNTVALVSILKLRLRDRGVDL